MRKVIETYIVDHVSSEEEAADEYFGVGSHWSTSPAYWDNDRLVVITEIDDSTYRIEVVERY